MTTKHERLMALCHEDTCFSHKAELTALLSLVKQQHEALEHAQGLLGGESRNGESVIVERAITAYNEWSEGENQC